MPVISAIRKAEVPITGGMRAAPVQETDVIAPANTEENPVDFIMGPKPMHIRVRQLLEENEGLKRMLAKEAAALAS